MVARNGSDRGKLAYQKAFNDPVVKKTIKNKVNYAVSENEDGDRGETMLMRMMGCTWMYWAANGLLIGLKSRLCIYWAALG